MITFPLALRRCRDPLPERAWLLPGSSSAEWLAELCRLAAPLSSLQLYAVPRYQGDRTAAALLVVPGEPVPPRPRHSRLLPLARLGRYLYLPVDARLSPPMTDAELDDRLVLPVNLLHPTCGLVGFAAEDVLHASDLLLPPAPRPSAWDAADPGLAPPPRLLAVELAAPPSLEQLLEEGHEHIGTAPLTQLPPDPAARRPRRPSIEQWIARKARRFTDRVPHTAQGRTWVNALEDWANRVLRRALVEERENEIERLLSLLAKDPDEGLRFALPVHGAAGRGVAPPGGRLGRRTPDFDARRLRGGQPTDDWEVDPRRHEQLVERYRKLAQRELAFNRHRRAAYILAELLGDLRAAASALEQGDYFREAAQLFDERLKDRPAAARCLERGGLLTEALAIYRELPALRRCAEVLERLGRHAEAAATWRELVQHELGAGEHYAAARILEHHLAAPDEALAALASAWPHGAHAEQCLAEHFALLQRLGRHAAAREWITRHAVAAVPLAHATSLTRVLAGLATTPDAGLRALAGDRARVIIGAHLDAGGPDAAASLLATLRSLDPTDRLLGRDASRWQSPRPVARTATPARVLHRAKHTRLEVVDRFTLFRRLEATTIAGGVDGFWALDCRRSQLERRTWERPAASQRWRWPQTPGGTHGLLVPVGGMSRSRVFVAIIGGRLEGHDISDGPDTWWAGTPTDCHLPQGACRAEAGLVVLDRAPDMPLLRTFTPNGDLLHTAPFPAARDHRGPVPMAVTRNYLWLGGHGLVRVRRSPDMAPLESIGEGEFEHVARSPLFTDARLAIGCATGCLLVTRCDGTSPTLTPFAKELTQPLVTFTGGGSIAAASSDGIVVAVTSGSELDAESHHREFLRRSPIALVPAAHPQEFAVVTEDGVVERFRIHGA